MRAPKLSFSKIFPKNSIPPMPFPIHSPNQSQSLAQPNPSIASHLWPIFNFPFPHFLPIVFLSSFRWRLILLYQLLRGTILAKAHFSFPKFPIQFAKFIHLFLLHFFEFIQSLPKIPQKMDEPNFYCLCKSTHVLTAARWIGILGSIGCTLGLAASLIGQSLAGVLISLATVPFYVSLLYAHHQHEPRLYLPFLVVNGLQTCLNALYIFFLIGMLILMPKFWQRHLEISIGQPLSFFEMRNYTILVLFGIGLLQLILCWFQSVVLHAYKYMCEEQITLIPPQLSPTFEPSTKKEYKFERESQLA